MHEVVEPGGGVPYPSDVGDQPWPGVASKAVVFGCATSRCGLWSILSRRACRVALDDLVKASKLAFAEVVSGLTSAVKRDWITQIHDTVELKAAGIHIAKKKLDMLD